MVVSVMIVMILAIEIAPSLSVIVCNVVHATSREVVKGGIIMVVGVDSCNGGRINLQGGWQYMTGFCSTQMLGSIYTSFEEPEPELVLL